MQKSAFSIYLAFLVSEELSGVLDHLLIGELGVRLLFAKGQRLPQSHSKGPHITGCGELSLQRPPNVYT